MRANQKKAIELFRQQVLTGNYKSVKDTLLEAAYARHAQAHRRQARQPTIRNHTGHVPFSFIGHMEDGT